MCSTSGHTVENVVDFTYDSCTWEAILLKTDGSLDLMSVVEGRFVKLEKRFAYDDRGMLYSLSYSRDKPTIRIKQRARNSTYPIRMATNKVLVAVDGRGYLRNKELRDPQLVHEGIIHYGKYEVIARQ